MLDHVRAVYNDKLALKRTAISDWAPTSSLLMQKLCVAEPNNHGATQCVRHSRQDEELS
jgi:hypothetical protein